VAAAMRRQHRLKRRQDFALVYDAGRSVSGRLLVLYCLHGEPSELKIGFAAGRKLGNAVIRNRIKRLLREVARQRLGSIALGHRLIVIARHNALKASIGELDKEFAYLLKKLNLIYQR